MKKFIALMLLPCSAIASQCDPSLDISDYYDQADHVFRAKIVNVQDSLPSEHNLSDEDWCTDFQGEYDPSITGQLGQFKVVKEWKGTLTEEKMKYNVYTGDGSVCLGSTFSNVNKEYIIFGKAGKNDTYDVYDFGGVCASEPKKYSKQTTNPNFKKLVKQLNKLSAE